MRFFSRAFCFYSVTEAVEGKKESGTRECKAANGCGLNSKRQKYL